MLAVAGLGLGACSDDGGGGDRDAFCATAERFAVDNPAAAFARYDPNEPEAAAVLLRDAAGRLQGWADEAAGAVRDDVEALADAASALAQQFEDPDDGDAADTTDDVDSAAVEAASANVLQYTQDECGVSLDAETPTPTP